MSKLMAYSLVSIAIILVTAFMFFQYLEGIEKVSKEAVAKQTCKASVQTAAALKFRYADFSGEIKCPTVKLEINDKNENIVKKKVADAMYDCWDQFDRGVPELFADDNLYCAICHKINFSKNVKFSGLTKYMTEKNAPGQKISYLQFLTTERTQNSEFLNELENKRIEDAVDASRNNEYAIVFTYIKGKKYLDDFLEKSKYTAPGAGIMALGFGVIKAGGAVGGTVSLSVVGAPAGLLIAKGSIAAGGFLMAVGALWTFVAPFLSGVPFEHIALISFVPYDTQNLQSLNCKELPIAQS